MIVTITGPRNWITKSKEDPYGVTLTEERILTKLIALKIDNPNIKGLSMMKAGVDLLFTECCIGLSIPVTAVLSCKDQSLFWDRQLKERFNILLSHTDQVIYATRGRYVQGCIDKQLQATKDIISSEKNGFLIIVKGERYGKVQQKEISQLRPYCKSEVVFRIRGW